MQSAFIDLLNFFGIPAMPANLGEFMPWFLSVCVALGIVLFIFRSVLNFSRAGMRMGRF